MTNPLDKENMEQVILDSPQQYLDGLKAAEQVASWTPSEKIEKVLVCAMGGSWMFAALLRDSELVTTSIHIHRAYGLPSWVNKNTLVVASSFSGNTEETLSAYEKAKELGLPLLGVAAGGELEKRCTQDGVPFIKIPATPANIQPRCATGYTIGIFAALLSRLGLAVPNAKEQIEGVSKRLTDSMAEARTLGEQMAPEFKTVTPIIYTTNEYKSVARIWKIKCNENGKTPAFWNFFPELNHNEMCGWTLPHGSFHIVILRDQATEPMNIKRMEITARLLTEKGIKVSFVEIAGATKAEKVFSTLLIGDWFSYNLALELGINPSPVDMVEEFKKLLKQ